MLEAAPTFPQSYIPVYIPAHHAQRAKQKYCTHNCWAENPEMSCFRPRVTDDYTQHMHTAPAEIFKNFVQHRQRQRRVQITSESNPWGQYICTL